MYGLGHGSLESLLFIAGLTFVHFVAYLVLSRLDLGSLARPLGVGPSFSFIAALRDIVDMSWDQPLAVAGERILSLPQRVARSLLVMDGERALPPRALVRIRRALLCLGGNHRGWLGAPDPFPRRRDRQRPIGDTERADHPRTAKGLRGSGLAAAAA